MADLTPQERERPYQAAMACLKTLRRYGSLRGQLNRLRSPGERFFESLSGARIDHEAEAKIRAAPGG